MKGSVPLEQKSFTLDGLSIDSDFSGTMEIVNGEIVFHGNDSAWSEFLGYSSDVLKGKPFLNFICPQDLDIAREASLAISKSWGHIKFRKGLPLSTSEEYPRNSDHAESLP